MHHYYYYFTLLLDYLNFTMKNISVNYSPNIFVQKMLIGSFILMQIKIIAITPTELCHST